jgi:hypothetical protein
MNIGSNEIRIQIAIQLVIMDALEKRHTNTEDLIQYMKSKVFEKAVKGYLENFNKEFNQENYSPEATDKMKILESVKNGTHPQFILTDDVVKCKCGHAAVWLRSDYLCGTITAYPCKYNK